MLLRSSLIGILLASLALSLTASAALGQGSNAGFEASVNPSQANAARIGQILTVDLMVANVANARQNRIVVQYDPTILGNLSFEIGDLIKGAIPLETAPRIGTDNLATIIVSAAQLGTSQPAGAGAGVLYTVSAEIISKVPPTGSALNFTLVQINASSQDTDIQTFAPGELGTQILPNYPNTLTDFEVGRQASSVTISWKSRFAGLDDLVRFRPLGETVWRTGENPLKNRFDPELLEVARFLASEGVDPNNTDLEEVLAALQRGGFSVPLESAAAYSRDLQELVKILESRCHLANLPSLRPGITYEFEVCSIGLEGHMGYRTTDKFTTRLALDLRPLEISDCDVQAVSTAVKLSWVTNRLAQSTYTIEEAGTEEVIAEGIINPEGSRSHVVFANNLKPNTRYIYSATSRFVGSDELLNDETLDSDLFVALKRGEFTTKSEDQDLRLLEPPRRITGPSSAIIVLSFNQITSVRLSYGPVTDADIPSLTDASRADIYPFEVMSANPLKRFVFKLTELLPNTVYRFIVEGRTPGGGLLTTDSRGNLPWSRDFTFKTSDATDLNKPEIIAGPQIFVNDRTAVLKVITDVASTVRAFVGTENGTYGTADEIEYTSLDPSGQLRLAHKHFILFTGLLPDVIYNYRLVFTAANGLSNTFEPVQVASVANKSARAHQPPGGGGSFLTNKNPDTSLPVILSGPTIVSKTHKDVVVEWVTDEPADSESRYGIVALDEEVRDPDSDISHKLVLSDLESGALYNYLVGSTDLSGNGSTESAPGVFITENELDITAPTIVMGPSVVYKSDRSAAIRWVTNEEGTGEVEFGTSTDLGFVRTQLETSTIQEVTLTNLTPGTTYFYKVFSTDLSNNGPTESTLLSFETDASPDLVSPVISNTEVTPSFTSATFRWDTDEPADSFVDIGLLETVLDRANGTIEDTESHELVLTNLEPGTTYFYRVGSIDRADNPPALSEVLSFTTLGSADTTPPAQPTGLSGTPGLTANQLVWAPNSDPDLSGYNVYRHTGDGAFGQIASRISSTNYTDSGLENGTTYTYRITAVDRELAPNESSPSPIIELTPGAFNVPTQPDGLRAEGSAIRPTLIFTNATPAQNDASLTYTVQVSSQSDFSDVTATTSGLLAGSGEAEPGTTAWIINRNLQENTTYYWRVRAVENGLVGPFSEAGILDDQIALAADFNSDGAVNFDDFFLFVDAFGADATGELVQFDLNQNGLVDFDDFFLFVDAFGRTAAGKRWAQTQTIDPTASLVLESTGGTREASQLISVKVKIAGMDQVKALGLVLDYDPKAVEFLEVQPTPAEPEKEKPLLAVLSHTPGRLVIGATLSSPLKRELAQVQFRSIGTLNAAHFELREAYVAASAAQVRRIGQLTSSRLVPQDFSLGANFPNPFNPTTTIEYALPQAGPLRLDIYDILGQRVNRLVDSERHTAGFYTVQWDGTDTSGRQVGNGVYFYRLNAENFTHTRKMLLLK